MKCEWLPLGSLAEVCAASFLRTHASSLLLSTIFLPLPVLFWPLWNDVRTRLGRNSHTSCSCLAFSSCSLLRLSCSSCLSLSLSLCCASCNNSRCTRSLSSWGVPTSCIACMCEGGRKGERLRTGAKEVLTITFCGFFSPKLPKVACGRSQVRKNFLWR